MNTETPNPHRLTYTARAHADRSGFFLTLTPGVILSFLSIGAGLGIATSALWSGPSLIAFFTVVFVWMLAVIQAVFAFAITPRVILSDQVTWADRALVGAVWLFGFGGTVLAIVVL